MTVLEEKSDGDLVKTTNETDRDSYNSHSPSKDHGENDDEELTFLQLTHILTTQSFSKDHEELFHSPVKSQANDDEDPNSSFRSPAT